MKIKIRNIFISMTLFTCVMGGMSESYAQGKAPVFIRDAEIEHALRTYALPLLKAAGLPPENVDIFIIQDNSLNAFVSGGMNLFIHTGLITESTDPLMLIGVMAHEIGHISGGHLVRKRETYEKAILGTALSYILGVGAVAAGSSNAGAAIISGGQHIATRDLLKHSRVQEQSADQAALNFLDKAKFSAEGLYALLQKLSTKEILFYDDADPYTLTHPLSQERLAHLQNYIKDSPYSGKKAPKKLRIMQKRIVAKIKSYLNDPKKTFEEYPETDNSVYAHYARAIAYHKKSDLGNALLEIDSLLQQQPSDPYFNELKGQILFEHGKVKESLPYYTKTVKLIPESSLLMLELATAQIATEDDRLLPTAISVLEKALTRNPDNLLAWRQLAIAYGKNKQLGLSYLALAEEATLKEDKDEALAFTKLAEKYLDKTAPALLRIKDIRKYLDTKYKEKSLF